MLNNIRETYKVNKTLTQQSYEYHLGLKSNPEYEKRVDQTFLDIVNIFSNKYKGVFIEPPRGREKSEKSLKNKIYKLEIERLCKLYIIEGITDEEKEKLYSLIIEDMEINKENKDSKEEIQQNINDLFFKEDINIENIKEIVDNEELEDNLKTACLRTFVARLLQEGKDTKKIKETIRNIEEEYGEKAAEKTKEPERNLLHYECIREIKNITKEMEKLHNPIEYTRVKDLRAFKIVIANVPDNIITKNRILKELINRRKKVPDEEKQKYNDLCCIELEKEFAKYLIENPELLRKMNIRVLEDGYKQKTKKNGYLADHIKFGYLDHPEYTFELQLRSIYREELSRANGSAAHDKRSGKKRVFPSIENKDRFLKELTYTTPKYTVLENKDGKYSIRKCTTSENMLEYYLGYIQIKSEEYKKIFEYLKDEDKIQK